MQGYSFFVDTV